MRLVVVDPASSGVEYLERAEERGVEHLVVLSAGIRRMFADDVEAVLGAHPGSEVVELSDDDATAPLDPRLAAGRWDAVVCGSEIGAAVADHLRDRLGVSPRNAGPSAPRLDKFAAQEALRAAGLRHIRTDSVSGPREVEALGRRGFPLVVKPPHSAGTDGVRVVADGAALAGAVDDLLGVVNALGRRNDHVVVQEFVEGDEYVVDGVAHGDGWRPASVCRYEKDLVDGMPVYRSLTWLARDEIPDADGLERYVGAALAALGVRCGAFHAELFRTRDEWVLIEVGLRPHGGGHPRYCEALTGTSQIVMELDAAASGALTPGPLPPLLRRGRVAFFSVDRPVGFHTDPLERLEGLDGIVRSAISVRAGQTAHPPRTLFDTFGLGFVVLVADTPAQLAGLDDEVRRRFAACYEAEPAGAPPAG